MDFKWKKLGRIFDASTIKHIPWMKDYAQSPNTLIFPDFVRVYFSCRPDKDGDGQYVSYTGFVDLSRNNLFNILCISKHPVLPLGGLGEFDEFGVYPLSPVKYGNTIMGYYGGWTRGASIRYNTSIGLAISNDDGETFKRYGSGPVISYSPFEPYNIGSMKVRRFSGNWYMFYVAGSKWKVVDGKTEPVYKIRMAVSKDGYNWEKCDRNLITNKLEEDEAQSGPDVFYHNGMYHMFFCYRRSYDYRNKEGGLRIGYASSNDLFSWIRDDSKAGITVSEEGWDSEMVRYPHVFSLNNKIFMMYNGNDFGRTGFGLAVLED